MGKVNLNKKVQQEIEAIENGISERINAITKLYESHIESLQQQKDEYERKYHALKNTRTDEQMREEYAAMKRELGKYKSSSKKYNSKQLYFAYVSYAGRKIEVGQYNTIDEAEKASKRAVKALQG